MERLGAVTYSVDIGNGWMVKRLRDELCEYIHYSPESSSNPIDDYYYSYQPVTPVQEVDPVLLTPPRPLEEKRRYPQRQHRPLDCFIHENY